MVAMRWENDTRYYGCTLQHDLLGDLVLFQYWGGKFNSMGSQKVKLTGSTEQAHAIIARIHKMRIKRGYQLVRNENAPI